jgi:single-strand DNA-binding protein
MQRNQNVVRLVGQAAKDIECSKVQNGHAKAVLYLTTKEVYINRTGTQVQQTGWYRAIATGRMAEQLMKSVGRGDQVAIHGKLCHHKYYPKVGPVKQMTEIAIQGFFPLQQAARQNQANNEPLPF